MAVVVDINKVLQSEEAYTETYNKYYNKVREVYANKDKVVTVKFSDKESEKLKICHLLVNMVFWKPFLVFQKPVSKKWLFQNIDKINSDMIATYLDDIIEEFLTDSNRKEVNYCIGDIIRNLGYFSLDFNKKVGNTISLYSFIQLAKKNERFNELINTKYDKVDTLQIENTNGERTKEILKILSEEENCFQDYVNCKEGLNKNQLTQFMINIGPKPDLKGNVYPKTVNTNFITNGLTSVSDYFINASGGRKAAITNHSKTKESGYLTRKLSMLCSKSELDLNVADCKTTNYLPIKIKDKATLKRCNKRFYLDEKTKKLKYLDIRKIDFDSVKDKELLFRSPITCACKDGKICKTCYGSLWRINQDIHIGILAATNLTSQLTQTMLSSKHLLKTSTKKIDWNEIFSELFTLNGNTLTLNQSIDGLNRYSLLIEEEAIQDNEEGLEAECYDDADQENETEKGNMSNITKYFRRCTIKKKIEKLAGRKYNGDYEYYEIDNGVDLYMSPYFDNILKNKAKLDDDGTYEVNIKDLDNEQPIFYIEIQNDELSAVLSNIVHLIDKKDRMGCETYTEMVNTFIELCNDAGIVLNSVHMEIIVKELLRDGDDIISRPKFDEEDPSYQILRLSESVINSDSPVTSLSFERFKEQIYKARTYRKTGSSIFDDFFI